MAKIVAEVKILDNKLPALTAAMRPRASQVVLKTAMDIETTIKQSMQGSKGGRKYRRPGGNWHQASTPGDAPAIDTGNLVNSIQVEMKSDIEGVVSTGTDYAPYLEYGTAHMKKRPFMLPAAEKAWPAFNKAMLQVLKVI